MNNQTYLSSKYIVFKFCFYGINDYDDETLMIFQTMHFREPFICKKAESLAFTQIYKRGL